MESRRGCHPWTMLYRRLIRFAPWKKKKKRVSMDGDRERQGSLRGLCFNICLSLFASSKKQVPVPPSIINSGAQSKEYEEKDRISELADDILIRILSHMELIEAAKTSLLSTRWRYLWTNLANLDFDDSEMLVECKGSSKLAFVDRVNQAVSLHRAPLIKRFRVCCHLSNVYSIDIYEWVKFAMSKRVNWLELDLGNNRPCICLNHTLSWDVFNVSASGSGINFLTSLSLTSVNVNGCLLELVLSMCHGLERLFVEDSKDLVSLNVGDSSSKLRYLGIINCQRMESLELGAKNLMSFDFIGSDEFVEVVYNDLPLLAEASFGGGYCHALQVSDFLKIASFSAQLIKLSLNISQDVCYNTIKLPSFHNVKHLEMTVNAWSCKKLLDFTSFVDACPSLLEFELKVHQMCYPYKKEIWSEWKLQIPPPINQFSLYFFRMNGCDFNVINGWIKYALSRRVEKLVLHTVPYRTTSYALQCAVLKKSPCDIGLSFLKSLCLRNVNVCGEVLELVLTCCHLLEELRVENSAHLVNLKVTGSSSRLKYLAISRCLLMESLEICASSLLCFEISGPERVDVAYSSLPSLVEAVFSGGYCNHQLLPKFKQISCFSSQLVKLSLNLLEVYRKHIEFPAFPNVKQLELSVAVADHESLLPLASLAEACPVLHKLKLELWWKCCCQKIDSNEDINYGMLEEVKQWPEITYDLRSCSLPNLKIFEWVEYSGIDHSEDMELALYIVKNACRLEKLICHTTNPWCQFGLSKNVFRAKAFGRKMNYSDFLEYQICHDKRSSAGGPKPENMKKPLDASRLRAQQLASSLPSRVDVYII